MSFQLFLQIFQANILANILVEHIRAASIVPLIISFSEKACILLTIIVNDSLEEISDKVYNNHFVWYRKFVKSFKMVKKRLKESFKNIYLQINTGISKGIQREI